MEIRIGIRDVAREVAIETDASTAEVEDAVNQALAAGTALTLDDTKGGRLIVPAASIGYVHAASSEKGQVGFGIR